MAEIVVSKKACTVNPLKMSAPIGAALAFLGMERSLPLVHGAQGCTAFGLVLFVRHFRETIPLQTTAMNEVSTILGGYDNIEQALVNIHKRANPGLIGLVSTGLTETKGDDVEGFLKDIRARHPELAGMEVVFVSAPDFTGTFQEGYGKAVAALARRFARPSRVRRPWQVNILAGSHLSPGDVEAIRELVESFGLTPIMLPDLSGSLDGHIPETFLPHTLGGTPLEGARSLGESAATLAIGEHLREAAEAIAAQAGVPYQLFDRLTGLAASDAFVAALARIADCDPPARVQRERSQLQDAMLDGHFHFSGTRIALAAEPDLLTGLAHLFAELGAEIHAAVAPAPTPGLATLPCATVTVGDLEDFEHLATTPSPDAWGDERTAELLVCHSHGRQAAARLGLPLYRVGLPVFDRLGAAQRVSVLYRGTRQVIFDVANLILEAREHDAHDPSATAHSTPAATAARPGRAAAVPGGALPGGSATGQGPTGAPAAAVVAGA